MHLLAAEPVERFAGFGQPISRPPMGEWSRCTTANRIWLAAVPDRRGAALDGWGHGFVGVSRQVGNHVIVELDEPGTVCCWRTYVKARPASSRDTVTTGQRIGDCGNSGNSSRTGIRRWDQVDLVHSRGCRLSFVITSPGRAAGNHAQSRSAFLATASGLLPA